MPGRPAVGLTIPLLPVSPSAAGNGEAETIRPMNLKRLERTITYESYNGSINKLLIISRQ
jgi:hypothetical protein